jgi:hypothetical protein
MPLSYQFKDQYEKPIALDLIDKEICQDFHLSCDENNFSLMFMTITMIGDFATSTGKFCLHDFEKAIQLINVDNDTRYKILKYIYGKYYYCSWR